MYLPHLRKAVLLIVSTSILIVTSTSPVNAQFLFNNNPDGMYGTGGMGATTNNAPGFPTMAGDVFTPTFSGTATSFNFGGSFLTNRPPAGVSFSLALYATSGGVPTDPIAFSTLSNVTWTNSPDFGIYSLTGTIDTPFSLDSNVTYYLGLSGDPHSSDNAFFFNSTETPGPADDAYIMIDGAFQPGPSEFVSPSLAFSIGGTIAVPEPSSYLLFLIGFGTLVLVRYRRRLQATS